MLTNSLGSSAIAAYHVDQGNRADNPAAPTLKTNNTPAMQKPLVDFSHLLTLEPTKRNLQRILPSLIRDTLQQHEIRPKSIDGIIRKENILLPRSVESSCLGAIQTLIQKSEPPLENWMIETVAKSVNLGLVSDGYPPIFGLALTLLALETDTDAGRFLGFDKDRAKALDNSVYTSEKGTERQSLRQVVHYADGLFAALFRTGLGKKNCELLRQSGVTDGGCSTNDAPLSETLGYLPKQEVIAFFEHCESSTLKPMTEATDSEDPEKSTTILGRVNAHLQNITASCETTRARIREDKPHKKILKEGLKILEKPRMSEIVTELSRAYMEFALTSPDEQPVTVSIPTFKSDYGSNSYTGAELHAASQTQISPSRVVTIDAPVGVFKRSESGTKLHVKLD